MSEAGSLSSQPIIGIKLNFDHKFLLHNHPVSQKEVLD